MTFLPVVVLVVATLRPVVAAPGGVPGQLVEHVPCPSDPTERYTLYLPSSYVPSRRWPLLLVFDPGARARRAAEEFEAAAERFGWIVAVSENSRNGPWERSQHAVAAMWPALLDAYAVDPGRIYTAGHSGGASVAWALAVQTGQVAGVIASGQPDPGQSAKSPSFAWFGSAGYVDFNLVSIKAIDARVAESGKPHRVEFFDGGHQWPPLDVIEAALGWLEVTAMREKRRAPDPVLATGLLDGELKKAHALEQRGALTDARRSYASIVDTYASFGDVADAGARMSALDADNRVKDMRRAEERSDARERERVGALDRMLSRLAAQEPVSVAELQNMVELPSLIKKSRADDYDGRSAGRTIELLLAQLASARRQFDEIHDFGRAAAALELAAGIHPDRAALWIDLAAERVASGQKGAAVAALHKAFDAGYNDKEALRTDPRFERLRGVDGFDKMVK
jgi:predicted esterase